MNELNPLEIQFIKASLSSKTDSEIAGILELPVDAVSSLILEVTGLSPQERSAQEEAIVKDRLQITTERKLRSVKANRDQKKNTMATVRKTGMPVPENDRAKRKSEKRFETKQVDLSKMHAVRLDAKTIVFVKPGQDARSVIALYQHLKNKNKITHD